MLRNYTSGTFDWGRPEEEVGTHSRASHTSGWRVVEVEEASECSALGDLVRQRVEQCKTGSLTSSRYVEKYLWPGIVDPRGKLSLPAPLSNPRLAGLNHAIFFVSPDLDIVLHCGFIWAHRIASPTSKKSESCLSS